MRDVFAVMLLIISAFSTACMFASKNMLTVSLFACAAAIATGVLYIDSERKRGTGKVREISGPTKVRREEL